MFQAFDQENCKLRPETGMCLAYFERYYFDSNSKTCKQFVYGGCGGNLNRFETVLDCLESCLPKKNSENKSTKSLESC